MKKIRLFLIIFFILIIGLSFADMKLNGSEFIAKLSAKVEALFEHTTDNIPTPTQLPKSALPSVPGSGKIKLASWNIRMFSSKSRDDTEIEQICNVMEKFDIIAIQELKDTAALDRCVRLLRGRGLEYKYTYSKKVGTRVHKEFYAILYRPNMITYLGDGVTYPDYEKVFIREPYYASFRAGNFDFTLATIHVLYGSGKRDPKRRAELDAIAYVFNEIQKNNKDENDIIFTGDFNENSASPRFEKMFEIDTIRFLIGGKLKTVIYDSSLYDNIIFQSKYTDREYAGSYGVFKFDELNFDNQDDIAKKAVSDHRPVWAEFYTNKSDDD